MCGYALRPGVEVVLFGWLYLAGCRRSAVPALSVSQSVIVRCRPPLRVVWFEPVIMGHLTVYGRSSGML